MARANNAGLGAVVLLLGASACLEPDPSFAGGDGTSSGTDTDASGGGTAGTGTGAATTDSAGSGGGTTAAPTTGSGGGSTSDTGNCGVETCNGMDDDCDGLIDEVGDDNTACNDCNLEQHEGHAYWFCADPRRWMQARSDCQDWGAELVSIPDEAANTFLAGHLGMNGLNDRFWIGANDRDTENTWVWEDGLAWGYENWAMDEPNDTNGEDCVEMWSMPAGTWNDSDCGDGLHFVCWAPHTP